MPYANTNPPPSLPSMASLLNGQAPISEYAQHPPPQRQFGAPYNMANQSTWRPPPGSHMALSPQAYQPPPEPSHQYFSQSPTDGILVSHTHTQQALDDRREVAVPQYSQPVTQRRQIRKITQRAMGDRHRNAACSPPRVKSYEEEANSSRYQQDHPQASRQQPVILEQPVPQITPRSQGSRSLSVSTLLSEEPRYFNRPVSIPDIAHINRSAPTRPPPTYTLRMRQEPIAARACGFGERDRRVIDPPPILQMHVSDPHASPEELSALLRCQFAVVHCTLWDPTNDRDDTTMPSTADKRQQRRLMGTLVSSPFVGKDEFNAEGCFFTFPDLSVRTPGTYSLRFSLVILNPALMGRPGASNPIQSVIKTASFNVYNAKDFEGMKASTALTKTLKHQGCLISVKKGNARAKKANEQNDDDDGDDEDDEDHDGLGSSRVKKVRH